MFNTFFVTVILSGISAPMLEYLLDYIYRGEVTIKPTDFEDFLQTAKDLQIKGLDEDEDEDKEHLKTVNSTPTIPAAANVTDSCEPASNIPQYHSSQFNGHQKTAEKNETKRAFVYISNDLQNDTNMVDENTLEFDINDDDDDDGSSVVELIDALDLNKSIEPRRKRVKPNYCEISTDEEHEEHEDEPVVDVPNGKC